MGVEPTYQPWEGRILPMNYTRIVELIIADHGGNSKSFFVDGAKSFPPQHWGGKRSFAQRSGCSTAKLCLGMVSLLPFSSGTPMEYTTLYLPSTVSSKGSAPGFTASSSPPRL